MKNIKKKAVTAAAISGLTAVISGVLVLNPMDFNNNEALAFDNAEKCKGIARKGMNDCGANGHACSGFAAVDNDPNEWIYVPAGMCEQIKGGSVKSTKNREFTSETEFCFNVSESGDPLALPKGVCEKISVQSGN